MAQIKSRHSADNFFRDVYEVAKLIPKGRVTTYGAIAQYLGVKSSARMVGWAMNGCPRGIPAHRVVNRIGMLTGKHHFKDPDGMERRLAREGVRVVNDRVQDFAKRFWDPLKELG